MKTRTARSPSRRKPWLAAVFLFASFPAAADEVMTADAARDFVAGRFFTYHCFDGTYGAGRIYNDGSAAGTIRVTGRGASHYLRLPASTLYVSGSQICARLKGLPFEPCFNLVKTGPESFRGSLSRLGFMYCNFSRSPTHLVRRHGRHKSEKETGKKTETKSESKSETKSADDTADMKLRH